MAKKEFKSEVIEKIGDLREYNGDYTKTLLRMIWGDNPITTDIRMVNNKNNFVGKGISLNDEEVENLVNMLIKEGYGSKELMKQEIVKEMKRTNPDIKSIEDCDESISCAYYDEDEQCTVVEIPKYN